jgi:hypothetical protein
MAGGYRGDLLSELSYLDFMKFHEMRIPVECE